MKKSALPMSKGKRGPVDSNAGKPRSPKKNPKGTDTKGIHPMTPKTGNVKMNKALKGVDKSKSPKGVAVPSTKRTGLSGMYF